MGSTRGGYRCRVSWALLMFCIIDVDMTVPVSSVMPADNITYHNMEASKFMNRADHVYSSMVEVMYEKHEKGSKNAQVVPGEHAILMFLLCGLFLTAGWGGHNSSSHSSHEVLHV
jgi:hypothetical protein